MTTTEEETKKKVILVTGGNAGIGYALCKQLVLEHDCVVYLGARNVERGTKAVQDIQDLANRTGAPEKAQNIHFLLIDVSDDASVQAAAATLKAQLGSSSSSSSSLYGLVNNAGVGLKTGSGCENELLATNLYGPKRVTEAFVTMIEQRIVNVSSGAASIYLRDQSSEVKHFFTNPATTWENLVAAVEEKKTLGGGGMGAYGLSKAALNLLTIQQGLLYPHLVCSSISPGFIATQLTAGWGAKLTPEQGTVSIRKCLFSSDIISGYYYGSDGLRSPLTMTRDPGTPEYKGEDETTIDRSKYNK